LPNAAENLKPNPDEPARGGKAGKEKDFYHEITKGWKHEIHHELFRAFQLSYFRDCFFNFPDFWTKILRKDDAISIYKY